MRKTETSRLLCLRKSIVLALVVWFLFCSCGSERILAERQPIFRYTVIPEKSGQFISVQAEMELQRSVPYLKDFGQLESILWYIEEKEAVAESERREDILIFKGLPPSGKARIIYKLRCVTKPFPGYRKRLMGSSDFVFAREGLYLGIKGLENSWVEVNWELPPGWKLGLGHQGVQRFSETQRTLWFAGKMKQMTDETVDDHVFRIAVLEGVSVSDLKQSIDALKSIFRRAWQEYGPLQATRYGIAIFPKGSIGGGTQLHHTIASEEDWTTAVHEMLHWWTNFKAPAWFREGVHTYMAAKILLKSGLMDQQNFALFIKMCLQEHLSVMEREGRLQTLAESSANYDNRKGGGDIYGLMPIFAYKLDREIHSYNPEADLDLIFATVCQKRHQKLDILALIKEITGYDPGPLFQKYFYSKVDDVSELLK